MLRVPCRTLLFIRTDWITMKKILVRHVIAGVIIAIQWLTLWMIFHSGLSRNMRNPVQPLLSVAVRPNGEHGGQRSLPMHVTRMLRVETGILLLPGDVVVFPMQQDMSILFQDKM